MADYRFPYTTTPHHTTAILVTSLVSHQIPSLFLILPVHQQHERSILSNLSQHIFQRLIATRTPFPCTNFLRNWYHRGVTTGIPDHAPTSFERPAVNTCIFATHRPRPPHKANIQETEQVGHIKQGYHPPFIFRTKYVVLRIEVPTSIRIPTPSALYTRNSSKSQRHSYIHTQSPQRSI